MEQRYASRHRETRTQHVAHQRAAANAGVHRLAAGGFPRQGVGGAGVRPAGGLQQRAGHDFGISRISGNAMNSNQPRAVQTTTDDGGQKHI